MELIKILVKESTRGDPPTVHEGGGRPPKGAPPLSRGPPSRPPVPIFGYMKSFALEKNKKEAFEMKRRPLEAEPGQTKLGLRRSCSAGETSL